MFKPKVGSPAQAPGEPGEAEAEAKEFRELAERLKNGFARSSVVELKELGHVFAEKALVKREPRLVDFSVVAYSLAKFFDKAYILESPEWQSFSAKAVAAMARLVVSAKEGRSEECHAYVAELIKEIAALSGKLGRFVMGVVEKARVKAATQVYAHGASLGTAAELAGVEKRVLAKYVGQTLLHEKYATMSVKQRLKEVEKLFS